MAELVVVGGGKDPNGCPSGSLYALATERSTYLLDCGESSGGQLRRCGIDPLSVRAVFISHMHYDHVGGLFGFLSSVWMACRREEEIPPGVQEWASRAKLQASDLPESLMVAVPQESVRRLEEFLPAVYLAKELWHFDFDVQPIKPGLFYEDGVVRVWAHPNRHLASQPSYATLPSRYPWLALESYGFTVEVEGIRVAYSGNLAPMGEEGVKEFSPAADRAEVIIVETAHVPPEPLLSMLAATRAKRIILVHLHAKLSDRVAAYLHEHPDERFVRARNGMRLPV